MRYLDSNVFIFAATGVPEAKAILKDVAKGTINACTSCLTWDEVVWALKKCTSREVLLEDSRDLLEFPNLVFIPTTLDIIARAHEIMVSDGLDPRDAIHVASMLHANAKEIVSDDEDFDKVKGIKRTPVSS